MSLNLYKILVDTTNLADGHSIASYLVDGAGNLLSSTNVGGKQSLDVNVTQSALPNGAATEASLASVLAELAALSQADGSVWSAGAQGISSLAVRKDAAGPLTGVADGDWSPLQINAAGELKVSATIDTAGDYAEDSPAASGDVGIFSLLVRQDTLASSTSADGDYGAFKSNAKGELYTKDSDVYAQLVTANSTLSSISSNSSSTSSILTALSKAEDAPHASGDQGIQSLAVRKDAQGSNVSADGDYASLLQWSEGSLKVVDVANGAIAAATATVTSTAANILGANLANRKEITIQNLGAKPVFIGPSGVTAASGLEIDKGGSLTMKTGPAVNIFAITGSGTAELRILEIA